MQSATPAVFLPPVWPPPLSLATTCGISVDVFSSPYLDVSVQAVPHVHLFDSMHVTWILSMWVAPFGNPRINGYLLLPVAYRSLSRPSSAPDAKAFPLRSFQLDLASGEIRSALFPPPAFRLSLKTPLRSFARRLSTKTGFRRITKDRRRETRGWSRLTLVREILVLLRIMQAHKDS